MRLRLHLRLQLRAEDWTARSDVDLDLRRDSLLIVHDAAEAKSDSSALNQRFVSEHPARVNLPRFAVPVALREVLGHFDWMRPLFVVDRSGYRVRLSVFVLGRKLDAVKLRMRVHHFDPAVHADSRLNTTVFRRECVDFAGKWVQTVLISDDDKRE